MMVEHQLIRRGISDEKVLAAFRKVKRHNFVPPSFKEAAYADHPLPIGYGQTISQPYMVAIMTQVLQLKGGEKVLEIGTGSGYQAAVLAEISGEVYTVEKEKHLLEHAEKVLKEEGYKNVHFNCSDGTRGGQEESPFNGIIVTAAAPFVPDAFKEQLADGGRLVIPVGTIFSQMLVVVERRGEEFVQEDVCGCVFVPLVGEHGWK